MPQPSTPPPRRTKTDEIAYAVTAFVIAGAAVCSVISSCTPDAGTEKGPAASTARPLPVS